MRSLHNSSVKAGLILAIMSVAACGDDNDSPGALSVEVSATREVPPEIGKLRIPYVVHNRGTTDVTLLACEGYTMHSLERRDGARWVPAYLLGCPDEPVQPVTLPAGADREDAIYLGATNSAGTYRLKVWRSNAPDPDDAFITSRAFRVE